MSKKLAGSAFRREICVRNSDSASSPFATGIVMFVVLIPFFFTRGLIEMLGKDEVKKLLLDAVPKSSALSAKN